MSQKASRTTIPSKRPPVTRRTRGIFFSVITVGKATTNRKFIKPQHWRFIAPPLLSFKFCCWDGVSAEADELPKNHVRTSEPLCRNFQDFSRPIAYYTFFPGGKSFPLSGRNWSLLVRQVPLWAGG